MRSSGGPKLKTVLFDSELVAGLAERLHDGSVPPGVQYFANEQSIGDAELVLLADVGQQLPLRVVLKKLLLLLTAMVVALEAYGTAVGLHPTFFL